MTRKMFWDLLLAAVLIGALITVASGLMGCGHYQSTTKPVGEYKTSSDYAKDQEIKALKDRIESMAKERGKDWEEIQDLKQNNCRIGAVEGSKTGSNYPVATFDNPREVVDYNFAQYPNGDTKPRGKTTVKTLDIGKVYPDVICLKFESGGRTCFDTMEITER